MIAATAKDITAGKMRPTGALAAAGLQGADIVKMSAGPVLGSGTDIADNGPGGKGYKGTEAGGILTPRAMVRGAAAVNSIPGPGERGFKPIRQENLKPGEGGAKAKGPAKR